MVTTTEVAQIVRELVPGADVEIGEELSEAEKPVVALRAELSIENARTQLGWEPRYASIRDGIAQYVEHYRGVRRRDRDDVRRRAPAGRRDRAGGRREAVRVLRARRARSPAARSLPPRDLDGGRQALAAHRRGDRRRRYAACEADAILLGAMGLPDARHPDGREAGGDVIFRLRFGLDLYAGIRPVRLYAGGARRRCATGGRRSTT